MILVDSDVMIDVFRKHPPALAWMGQVKDQTLAMSGFVALELLQGTQNKREQLKVEKHLHHILLIWPSAEVCQAALSTFFAYHLSHNVSVFDALIGHTALAQGVTLYTFNNKHYEVITGLKCLNPYTR